MPRSSPLLPLITLALLPAGTRAATPAMTLEVDARDVTQYVQHVRIEMPVRPGPLTLAYPEWIPGEHAANGPLTQLVNLTLRAGTRTLPWARDPLDPFSFHLQVPPGTSTLSVQFDFLSPPKGFGDGYGRTPNATPHLLVLPFNHVVLYPADARAADLRVKARVRLPAGWHFDGALEPERAQDGQVTLPEVSLETLVDSPLLAGEHFRTATITEGDVPTRLSIAADAPADLAVTDAQLAALKRLVAEATAAYGPPHYRRYVWLTALADSLDQNGLEHHESTDIRDHEVIFTDPQWATDLTVFPHEYTHSWNGKYRRPQGLAIRNYQQPMQNQLLWVYEGLTRFYGDLVLATRAGLLSPEMARAYIAYVASALDQTHPGRAWRSLADTATALPGYTEAPPEWKSVRRGHDYYDEMLLVWLEADMLIRERSDGQHSLDDFCHRFLGGPERSPAVRPYTRAEVIQTLAAVLPFDWDAFLHSRVDEVRPRAPLWGVEASGWRLAYDDTPNEYLSDEEKQEDLDNFSLSLGVWTHKDGTVSDVVGGSPAFAAGIAPTMRLIAIDGHAWSASAAREAIVRAEKTTQPLELIVQSQDLVRTLNVSHHGGLRYPHLVRVAPKPDRLADLLAPHAPH